MARKKKFSKLSIERGTGETNKRSGEREKKEKSKRSNGWKKEKEGAYHVNIKVKESDRGELYKVGQGNENENSSGPERTGAGKRWGGGEMKRHRKV